LLHPELGKWKLLCFRQAQSLARKADSETEAESAAGLLVEIVRKGNVAGLTVQLDFVGSAARASVFYSGPREETLLEQWVCLRFLSTPSKTGEL
jgi:hypothetical protein